MTGVTARTAGFDLITREIARAGRSGRPLIVALVVIDDLKAVQDREGHPAGDRPLRLAVLPAAMLSRPEHPLPRGDYAFEVKWAGFSAIVSIQEGVRSRRGWNKAPLIPELAATTCADRGS